MLLHLILVLTIMIMVIGMHHRKTIRKMGEYLLGCTYICTVSINKKGTQAGLTWHSYVGAKRQNCNSYKPNQIVV